jgi:hypothetical protein
MINGSSSKRAPLVYVQHHPLPRLSSPFAELKAGVVEIVCNHSVTVAAKGAETLLQPDCSSAEAKNTGERATKARYSHLASGYLIVK